MTDQIAPAGGRAAVDGRTVMDSFMLCSQLRPTVQKKYRPPGAVRLMTTGPWMNSLITLFWVHFGKSSFDTSMRLYIDDLKGNTELIPHEKGFLGSPILIEGDIRRVFPAQAASYNMHCRDRYPKGASQYDHKK